MRKFNSSPTPNGKQDQTSTSLRLTKGVRRKEVAKFSFDGHALEGYLGEPLAAALWASGIRSLRRAPGDDRPRGMFCAMGNCQECCVLINGLKAEACRAVVNDGMVVQSIRGAQ